ncbi:serpin family protein [candidate division KSB1 bacterium]
MSLKRALILSLSILFLVICSKENNPVTPDSSEPTLPRALSKAETDLISSENEFAFKLFKETVNVDKDKNIFISPLSISMALGMTLNGADGETKDAMVNTLEFADMTDEEINSSYKSLIELLLNLDSNVAMQIANSIWCLEGYPVIEDFKSVNRTYFDAEVSTLNFFAPGALDIINGWVYDNTNGRIEDIIDEIPFNARLYVINALFFKGDWTYKFDPADTKDKDFFLLDETSKTVKMMGIKTNFGYYDNENFQAVDLPYGNGNYCMTIFLPKYEVEIDEIASSFSQENWNNWINSFTEREVNLFLPKFKLDYKIEEKTKTVLTSLGMGVAFDEWAANFSRINENNELFISRVIHKTFIEVNEEGTEASAATVVEISYRGIGDDLTLAINKPFIFVIREKVSGTILFMGKIINPEY